MIRLANPTEYTGSVYRRQQIERVDGASYRDLLCSAPIDAPDKIPAGSTSGAIAADWRGRTIPCGTSVDRD